ncbi:hypothetical protein ACFPYI_07645 [Halomarina salina]|uniref:Small CPxCG-related zinc finger protein n=1 Tax=Halomarina salina TaxID=1872699 RepID=A0ABD5RLH7_9EURY|nr:hypothetical protein [Halomarina salina]
MSTTLQRPRDPTDDTDADSLATDATDCPDCGESVVDGQGLVACTDCHWTGIYA